MIITPQSCLHYIAENFKENLNKTCELKGKCQLISDKASCSKYTYRADTGFWDKDGKYKENRRRNKFGGRMNITKQIKEFCLNCLDCTIKCENCEYSSKCNMDTESICELILQMIESEG